MGFHRVNPRSQHSPGERGRVLACQIEARLARLPFGGGQTSGPQKDLGATGCGPARCAHRSQPKARARKQGAFVRVTRRNYRNLMQSRTFPEFSHVKSAAWFNMLVPNEGFPHILQGIIILLLTSMC